MVSSFPNPVDVFVIGGGPAGLATAIAARRRGLSVVLADGAVPPIDKPCGEGLMPDGVAALNHLGITVPEGEGYFSHSSEGPDDMPSHIRMALTRTSESIPIAAGQLWLGTWQGLFLYEHRAQSAERSVIVSVIGTTK